jgi:hypothetical protein
MLIITVQGLPAVHAITLRDGYVFDMAGTVPGVKRNLFMYFQIKNQIECDMLKLVELALHMSC